METQENIDFIANVCLDNVADDDLPQKVEGPVILIDQDPALPAPVKSKRGNQIISHFMTWNNYPVDGVETLERCFQPICKSYCFQKEVGTNGTPHLQGVFNLKTAMRWSEFNLPKGIHWEGTRNLIAAQKYCSKDDTRDGPDVYRWPVRAAKPVVAPRAELKILTNLYPWQQSIVDIINGPICDRTIHWIYDKEGCMGKTELSKYLYAKHDAIIATGGSVKDLACMIAMTKKPKFKGDLGRDLNVKTTFAMCFARDSGKIDYTALEQIKDGSIFSSKYESGHIFFNRPHLFIFSNALPDTSGDKMTADKWKIWTIADKELVPYGVFEDTSFNDDLLDLQGVDKLMFV